MSSPTHARSCSEKALTISKQISDTAPSMLPGLARYIQRDLNFRVDADGRGYILEGPEIGLLDTLDRIVRLSAATTLQPYLITYPAREWLIRHQDELEGTQVVPGRIPLKAAEPNPHSIDAAHLAQLLRRVPVHASIYCPQDPKASRLLYAPHLRPLIRLIQEHSSREVFGRSVNSVFDASGKIVAECLNEFIEELRRAIRAEKQLRRAVFNWSLSSAENASAVASYLDVLFDRHGSLTVLRLRLFHARERVNLISTSPAEQRHDLEALRTCRAIFFDRMRRNKALFTDRPGVVWSIQPSLEGGYDLDLTLLFNTEGLRRILDEKGAELRTPASDLKTHADLIGEYWVRVATHGRGGYRCADTIPSVLSTESTDGAVGADSTHRRQRLERALTFLAVRRSFVRLKDESGGPYFGLPNRSA